MTVSISLYTILSIHICMRIMYVCMISMCMIYMCMMYVCMMYKQYVMLISTLIWIVPLQDCTVVIPPDRYDDDVTMYRSFKANEGELDGIVVHCSIVIICANGRIVGALQICCWFQHYYNTVCHDHHHYHHRHLHYHYHHHYHHFYCYYHYFYCWLCPTFRKVSSLIFDIILVQRFDCTLRLLKRGRNWWVLVVMMIMVMMMMIEMMIVVVMMTMMMMMMMISIMNSLITYFFFFYYYYYYFIDRCQRVITG